MEHLNLETGPGRYQVDTTSGATYIITISAGQPATMLRLRTTHVDLLYEQHELWGDEATITLTSFSFTVGQPGRLWYWDEAAREHPGYERSAGAYPGTVRRTTPVRQISRLEQESDQEAS